MAFRSPSDGAPFSPNQPSLEIPGQTKVSGDCQREPTHEICCLAAELKMNEYVSIFATFYFDLKSPKSSNKSKP